MIEQDTIRLLRECDAGIKMGVTSIEEIINYAQNEMLKKCLETSMAEHKKMQKEIQEMLSACHDDGKNPPIMARGMSWLKTNAKLIMNQSDAVISDLITDGCNMGAKSLYKYLSQYKAASEEAKNIAKRLISLEEKLAADMRIYSAEK